MTSVIGADQFYHFRLLRDALLRAVEAKPSKAAVVVEGRVFTYSELYDAASRFGQALVDRGIEKGDRVAVYLENSWDCVVAVYGTMMAAGVFLVLNPQIKAEKLEFILRDSGAKLLITSAALERHYGAAVPRECSIERVLLSGEPGLDSLESAFVHEKIGSVIRNTLPLSRPVDAFPGDLAALVYTSGSTGVPKGVMHTNRSMTFAVWSLLQYQRLSEEDRILSVLPMSFDYGLYQLFLSVALGATLYVERSFTFPTEIYHRIKESRITVFPALPTIFAILVASHKKKRLLFPTIKRVTNTAAALPPAFVPKLHEIFPQALIFNMYGLTECKRVSYLEPELLDKNPQSVGKAIPGTEVYILSGDGKRVGPNVPGILYVKGPHIMSGYWNDDALTHDMLKSGEHPDERVLCTHDIFRMDEDGLLYFVSRSDDIIKSRGEKVSPVEVENILHDVSGVEQVGVVGIADDILGQKIVAVVVKDKTAEVTENTIKKFCLAHMERLMIPEEIHFVETLPRTSSGKLDRQALLRLVKDMRNWN